MKRAIVVLAALAVATHAAPAFGAASNPKITRGSGNQLILTFEESTKNFGLHWWLDGSAYSVTDVGPKPGCGKSDSTVGVRCTWLPDENRTGTITITMTTDKLVSPNTNTNLEVDSQGASDQMFKVLVEGTGDGGAIKEPPKEEKPPPPPPPPTDDKTKKEQKEAAAADARDAFEKAKIPCGMAGVGLAGAVGFLPVSGAGPIGAAALPLGTTGAMTAAANLPNCAPLIAQIVKDLKIIEDPPDPNFGVVALAAPPKARKPRSCAKVKRAARKRCTRLAAALAAYGSAVARVSAINAATSTATDRRTTAEAALDAPRMQLQSTMIRALAGEMAAAVRAQNAAGAALARVLRQQKVKIVVPAKNVRRGIDEVLKRVAAGGGNAALLRTLAGPLVQPKPIDFVALLARPAPTAQFDVLARGLTLADVNALAAQLAAQRLLTPPQAAALAGAATNGTGQALRIAARLIPGEPGELLRGATALLP